MQVRVKEIDIVTLDGTWTVKFDAEGNVLDPPTYIEKGATMQGASISEDIAKQDIKVKKVKRTLSGDKIVIGDVTVEMYASYPNCPEITDSRGNKKRICPPGVYC